MRSYLEKLEFAALDLSQYSVDASSARAWQRSAVPGHTFDGLQGQLEQPRQGLQGASWRMAQEPAKRDSDAFFRHRLVRVRGLAWFSKVAAE
jgi:hypothetical protein